MSDPLPVSPALRLVLDLQLAAHEERRARHDALDQKAGGILAFAGVLITLSGGVGKTWRAFGISALFVAVFFSLMAVRTHEVDRLGYLAALADKPGDETASSIINGLDVANKAIDKVLNDKATYLNLALYAAAIAVVLLGVGVLRHP